MSTDAVEAAPVGPRWAWLLTRGQAVAVTVTALAFAVLGALWLVEHLRRSGGEWHGMEVTLGAVAAGVVTVVAACAAWGARSLGRGRASGYAWVLLSGLLVEAWALAALVNRPAWAPVAVMTGAALYCVPPAAGLVGGSGRAATSARPAPLGSGPDGGRDSHGGGGFRPAG